MLATQKTPFALATAALAVAAASGAATAQTAWTLQTPVTTPPPVTAHGMAYLTATDSTVCTR